MALITLKKLAHDKGMTENSLRKIKERYLEKGVHWFKTPATRIMFDTDAYEIWEKSGN